jgi:hypothetical protein
MSATMGCSWQVSTPLTGTFGDADILRTEVKVRELLLLEVTLRQLSRLCTRSVHSIVISQSL